MQGIPLIKAVMTPFPYSIDRDAPITAAREMMARHSVRRLPVMEDGNVIGMISDRDIQLVLGLLSRRKLVRDVCVTDVYVVELTEPLDRVLADMAERHVDSAIVVKHGKLAGIFTVTDACRLFGDLLRSLFPSPEDREPA